MAQIDGQFKQQGAMLDAPSAEQKLAAETELELRKAARCRAGAKNRPLIRQWLQEHLLRDLS